MLISMYSWSNSLSIYYSDTNNQWWIQDFPDSWGGMGERGEPMSFRQNLLFGKIFAENCVKMKEIGPRVGVVRPERLLCSWSANDDIHWVPAYRE